MTVVPIKPPPTLGGSDAAAAAGIDPHRSRVMLWLEKTGRVARGETEAMRWGKLLEALVVDELDERGFELQKGHAEVRDPERAWCVGHPDGLVILDGEPAILKVKTINAWAHRSNGDGPPLQYVAQVQHYLHLTGLARAMLAFLIGGQRLESVVVERDPRSIDLLLDREAAFHWHLVTDTPPAPDGSDSARDALAAMFPAATPERVCRLDQDAWALLRALRERREQRDTVDTQVTELENRLKLVMGDAELAVSPVDTEAIRWANVSSRRVDVARLKEEMPAVYEQFATETATRRFTLL